MYWNNYDNYNILKIYNIQNRSYHKDNKSQDLGSKKRITMSPKLDQHTITLMFDDVFNVIKVLNHQTIRFKLTQYVCRHRPSFEVIYSFRNNIVDEE